MAAKKATAKKTTAKTKTTKAAAKKTVAKKTGPAIVFPPRVAGQPRYWLVKTEPDVFSFDDLMKAPRRTTFWDGVRNYQARNFMRDDMAVGDGVLVYHSNAQPSAVAGVARVAREAAPDETQFDPSDDHFDPTARPDEPRWYGVSIQGVGALKRSLSLDDLRQVPELAGMMLLRKGQRLSVLPVTREEWGVVLALGGRPDLV